MSEPVVYAVFSRASEIALYWDLLGVFADPGEAQMLAIRLCGDRYYVALRVVAVHEARKLELIPSVFAPVDWDELPGEKASWPEEEEEEGEE